LLLVTALDEVEVVPFWYVVEGASLTITFCPADVDRVKLDVETLPIVPDEPPIAGPERALEPPPSVAPPPGPWDPSLAEGDMDVVEVDAPQAAQSPITAHMSAAATTRLLRLGSEPALPNLWATNAPDVPVDGGRAVRGASGLAAPWSVMVALL
jgi:hypothetical protein